MSVETELKARSKNQCELCGNTSNLSVYDVPPNAQQRIEDSLLVCDKCSAQLEKKEPLDSDHWKCLLDSMWSEVPAVQENSCEAELHKDCNGTLLQNGDTVVLTKTLDVKGSSLKASLGTVVKNIRLVHDNTEQIEGKIDGQTIVILTKYLRKG